VVTKPSKPKHPPSSDSGRWRIVLGDKELGSFKSETLARERWFSVRASVSGHGAKLISPGGDVEG
jgi:hypothetical protein